jgi:hypothetical protein
MPIGGFWAGGKREWWQVGNGLNGSQDMEHTDGGKAKGPRRHSGDN